MSMTVPLNVSSPLVGAIYGVASHDFRHFVNVFGTRKLVPSKVSGRIGW
jgi:hypothetical protein